MKFIAMIEGVTSQSQLSTETMKITLSEQIDPMIISYDWQFLLADSKNGWSIKPQ